MITPAQRLLCASIKRVSKDGDGSLHHAFVASDHNLSVLKNAVFVTWTFTGYGYWALRIDAEGRLKRVDIQIATVPESERPAYRTPAWDTFPLLRSFGAFRLAWSKEEEDLNYHGDLLLERDGKTLTVRFTEGKLSRVL